MYPLTVKILHTHMPKHSQKYFKSYFYINVNMTQSHTALYYLNLYKNFENSQICLFCYPIGSHISKIMNILPVTFAHIALYNLPMDLFLLEESKNIFQLVWGPP